MGNFEKFINLYELSKTLRFELIAFEKTEELLKENQVFKKDKIVKDSYDKIKPYLDKLHRKFINESLENLELDFVELEKQFLLNSSKTKKNITKKEKEAFDKLQTKLRKEVVKWFTIKGENWKERFEKISYSDSKWKEKKLKIKEKWYKILLSDANLYILSETFTEEKEGKKVIIENVNKEKQNLFTSFKWFTTYFTNFNHSRENFYKDDWKAGRIATRIINENLLFFLKNKKSFDEKYRNNTITQKFQEKFNLFWKKLENFFDTNFYNKCLTGKQIEYYNQLIWELNSIINLEKQAAYSTYKQEKKNDEKVEFKKSDFPIFKELYKQILSKKTQEESFIEIENFEDIKKHLKELIQTNDKKTKSAKDLIESLIVKWNHYDFDKIYLTKLSLNTISAKFFGYGKWNLIQEKLLSQIGKKNANGKKDLPDFIQLLEIQKALKIAKEESEENIFKKDFDDIKGETIFVKFLKIFLQEIIEIIWENKKYKKDLEKNILSLVKGFSEEKEEKEKQIAIIKDYLDTCLNIFRMMKYFSLEKWKENIEWEYEIDNDFYNEFRKFYGDNQIIEYYNEFRNYLTKKTYSTDKIKLNFGNGTLLDGWDKNKEPDNFGTLLEKDWKYYLVVQVYGKQNIFYKKKWSSVIDIEDAYKYKEWENLYRKVDYKFLPDPKKMLPKVCFAKSNSHLFSPSEEIVRIKKEETFKTGEKFIKKDFEKIVDFYKESLKKYPDWQIFDFTFSDTKIYNNLSDFYREVEAWSYKLNFRDISEKYINTNIENWNIYLFEIYNKDFAEKKSGKPNLHTLYFKWLFEKENLNNVVLKLNWQAEIFRREASLKKKEIKRTEKNNSHEIVEKKRYTEDKLFFHCPIKLNFAKYTTNINQQILKYISNNKDINIIGIDRWEKHLAYFSVINQNGEILKDEDGNLVKWSLNNIFNTWYYNLLVKRENERKEARWSWKTIGNIKELKNGYISQVVHKLAELVIKYNAIIVFEDLNMWFKRWRQKIERQVYQKLEKALIEKLNYLTFKDKKIGKKWHYLSAYQLTAPFESFEKLGKQTGIIFYTDPSYTSSTCPICGFRKDLYIKYSNVDNASKDLKQIDKIYFEENKFIFEYHNKKVYSNRDRKRNERDPENNNEWITKDNNITENLVKLFDDYKINYKNWENIIEQIQTQKEKWLFKDLFYNFNAILSLRNSTIWDNSRDWDFIACPCCAFDTRKENAIGIENWDDNGAYNIARKGKIILNKIKNFIKEKDIEKIWWKDLMVKQEDWDEFVSGE